MTIEYVHASKYGNGAAVAAEFKQQMAAKGVMVDVHHVREVRPTELSPADLYVFSSPGRMGKPIGGMRRFLKKVKLPAGTGYAILTTEAAPKPDKQTGRMPTEAELAKRQRVRPIMNEILEGKGLVKIAEDKVLVTGLKGPLEEGWQKKVEAFVTQITAYDVDRGAAMRFDTTSALVSDPRSAQRELCRAQRGPRRGTSSSFPAPGPDA
jgi:menaquinone-dependent protoporphyrinogen IX oxidase